MRILCALCVILCLSQPIYLFAMAGLSTGRTVTPPIVHILKIIDEEGRVICDSRHLLKPSFSCTNIGIIDMAIARTTGIYTCATFTYEEETPTIIYNLLAGERGTFTFWIDDRAFWCNHETQRLVNIKPDKDGKIRQRPMSIAHVIPLMFSLQPNTNYWVTIRISKNNVEALM